jgi:hypothetical protein
VIRRRLVCNGFVSGSFISSGLIRRSLVGSGFVSGSLIRSGFVGNRFVGGSLVNHFLCNVIGFAHNSPSFCVCLAGRKFILDRMKQDGVGLS